MFRTITAKYAGICRRCNGPIAIGQQIRYAPGKGNTYHLATDCAATTTPQPQPAAATAPTDNELMSATIAASLQQTFSSLMQQPARMTDPLADIEQPEPVQPEPEPIAPIVPPLTFSTIAGATVKTVSPAEFDAACTQALARCTPPTVARISYNASSNRRRLVTPGNAIASLDPADLF